MIRKFLLLLLSTLLSTAMLFAQKQVTGKVTDEMGDPIVGASVAIKGTTKATITEIDGSFKISIPNDGSTILVFRFVGMKTVEKEVGGG